MSNTGSRWDFTRTVLPATIHPERRRPDAVCLNNSDIPMETLPPYPTADTSANRHVPIGCQNLDDQTGFVPTERPPTYDQIFTPKDTNTRENAVAGTSLEPSPNLPEVEPISIRRTIIIQGSGTGPDDNKNDENGWITCLKCLGLVLIIVVIVIVKVRRAMFR